MYIIVKYLLVFNLIFVLVCNYYKLKMHTSCLFC